MEIIYNIDDVDIQSCVATIGFFDGVHLGHQFLIEQVKQEARKKGLHSALVTFPVHPRKVMQADYQPQLLSTLEEKKELLARHGVDYCILLNFTPHISHLSAYEFMRKILKEKLNACELVIGYDHRFGYNRSEGFTDYCRYGDEMGMKIIRAEAFVCEHITVSSSLIRQLLQKGDIQTASHCLNYFYFLEGTVVDGYKMGRKIGFPTANLRIEDSEKLIPVDGVYAVRVTVEGDKYMGMLDIGHRPTFAEEAKKSIEVHILDFSSDIYGQSIRIEFIKRIRSDIKYPDISGLIEQLHKDAEQVRQIFADTSLFPVH